LDGPVGRVFGEEFIQIVSVGTDTIDEGLGEGDEWFVVVEAFAEEFFGDLMVAGWVEIFFEEELENDFAGSPACDHWMPGVGDRFREVLQSI
jgi:hypothetical protein